MNLVFSILRGSNNRMSRKCECTHVESDNREGNDRVDDIFETMKSVASVGEKERLILFRKRLIGLSTIF